jgi:hypothetical protein
VFELAWSKNGTPDTLGSSGDTLTISDLTALKFNQFMTHIIFVTGAKRLLTTTDNNTATDYAWRRSANGGADTTQINQANMDFDDGMETAGDGFYITYGINISSEEKLFISFGTAVPASGTGAGTASDRNEIVGKVDTTTNSVQYTRIDIDNDLAGSYDTSSNLSALGTD